MIVQETKANLTTWNPLKDLIIRVCVLNSAGCGPWSDIFLLEAREVMGECLLPFLHFGEKSQKCWDCFSLSLVLSVPCPFSACS